MAKSESADRFEGRGRTVGLCEISTSAGHEPMSDPWQTTVLDLFRKNVWQNPDAVALSCAGSAVTYRELWNFAAAFRDRISESGISAGDRVAIVAGRSIATVAAILGTVMAGACYVPIDVAEFPMSVMGRLVRCADVRLWIADRDARQSEAAMFWRADPTLAIEEVLQPTTRGLTTVSDPPIDGDSPFYVMFTSGSTGIPKGVVVPHRAVTRLVSDQDFVHFGPEEVFFLHSPLSFDASTLELWGGLLHGSRVVLAPAHRLGFSETGQLLAREGVTTLWMTAAMFHLAAERNPEIFASLRQLVFGGDVISPRSVAQIRALYPELRMVNGYGPTENTTFTCCYVVPRKFRPEGSLPIGAPIAHTTVHVLGKDGNEVPVGEEGELVAGGAGVAMGYLAQPETTAERFPLDPFSSRAGARLYRTGDRVRRREDGQIEFLGRIDRQIKIAGHRVELEAVEGALLESPQVRQAAVVVLTPAQGEKRLVACVSPAPSADISEPELHSWMSARLTRTLCPRHWLLLDQLPIGPTGKLDRSALQTMCETRFLSADPLSESVGSKDAVDDRPGRAKDISETTDALQRLWARLLGQSVVGAEESFFDLGGTSLLLIEMHSTLQERFGATLPLADLFDFPTPRALADRLCALSDSREQGLHYGEQRGQRQRSAMVARRRNREDRDSLRVRNLGRSTRKDGDQ